MDDLSYLEQLMGGASGESGGSETGGVWVVSPDGRLDDGLMRLVGKARVVADALGAYVSLLLAGGTSESAQQAIQAGADQVYLAGGMPATGDLVDFFRPRAPQVVLFPHTRLGRVLGPGLAQVLNGSLCGYAADLVVDPVYQRILAHKPVLDDAARQVIALLRSPAVVVVDTPALPAAFSEPWRTGQVEDSGLTWGQPNAYPGVEWHPRPVTLYDAPIVVGAGRGLRHADGFALAERLAKALGGVVAGDLGALDAGWIDEGQLVGLTGHSTAPKIYLALGIDGDTEHLAAVQGAGTIVAVQPDPTAPIAAFADWSVIADPVKFAEAMLQKLGA